MEKGAVKEIEQSKMEKGAGKERARSGRTAGAGPMQTVASAGLWTGSGGGAAGPGLRRSMFNKKTLKN